MSPTKQPRKKLPPLPEMVVEAVGKHQKKYGFSSWAQAAADLIVRGLRSEGCDIELPPDNWGGNRGG